MSDFTADELEGLSEDERAALEDDEASSSGSGTDGDEGDERDDDSAEGDDDDSSDDDDEGADDGVDDAAGDTDEGPEPHEDDTSAPDKEFQPKLTAVKSEGADDRLAALDGEISALTEQFEQGDISIGEFMKANQAIQDRRADVLFEQRQEKWAQAQNASVTEQRWQFEVERFFDSDSGKTYAKDEVLMAALDASVRKLAADPANTSRPAAWFIAEADRVVRERMNLGGASKPQDSGKTVKPRGGKGSDVPLPKTLNGLPEAEVADTGGDEFAHLERLAESDPMAYEAALRKMTPEQEARYLGIA